MMNTGPLVRLLPLLLLLLLPPPLRDYLPASLRHRRAGGGEAGGLDVRHPIVLVPGLSCSDLEARLTEAYAPSLPRCGALKGKGWFPLWQNTSELVDRDYVPCLEEQMSLVYDPALNDYRNLPGVETRVPNFGSAHGFTSKNDPDHELRCLARVREELEGLGYRDRETLFGAPYDIRHAPPPRGQPSKVYSGYFARLKELVQHASEKNQNKPVILIGHSFGGKIVLDFVNWTPLPWRQKLIKNMLLISPTIPTGFMEVVTNLASGSSVFLVPTVPPLCLRPLWRTFASSLLSLPSTRAFGHKPFVITKDKNYSAYDVVDFLTDLGFTADGIVPFVKRVLPTMLSVAEAPMVPTTYLVGVGGPIKESAYGLMFHRAIGFAPYGAYWRALRRVASTHLFSPRQVAASAAQRAVIARQMVEAMKTAAAAPDVSDVEARRFLKRASLHNVMWSVFGRKYEQLEAESEEATELKCLVDEGYDLLGQLNWSDHLPWLARFDLQNTRSRCSALVPRVNRFVSRIIDEHRARLSLNGDAVTDFTDVLLSLQGSDKLSDADMVAVLWEMIFRGTDTVAVLIEWVLARLVLHQDVQARVHEELNRVVGPDHAVNESDAASLVYLQAVIKEVLRLHPPGPLLSWARLATSDVHVGGFLVPSGTTAMVNMWAITHDPTVWAEPTEFKPHRFIGPSDQSVEFMIMGSDLRLAPFGSGRRSCPGKSLAIATVGFWVATLLHEFQWLPPSDGPRGVDLSEVLRLSCEMAAPLEVRLRPRRVV